MQDRTRGRLYVIAQLALLGALILPPKDAHWPTPEWLAVAGLIAIAAGLAVLLLAGTRLARSLTASPLPSSTASSGPPAPTLTSATRSTAACCSSCWRIVLRSGNAVTLLLALCLLAFFHRKAAWEESLLAAR